MVSPQNVLFVSHLANLQGGADRSLLTLVQNLSLPVVPSVLVPKLGQLTQELDKSNIRWIQTSYKAWIDYQQRPIRAWLRSIWNQIQAYILASKLQSKSIDLVYTNTLYTPFGAMLAHHLNVPHIWHAREFVQEDMGADYDRNIQDSMNFINDKSSLIICNSRAIKAKMASYIPSPKMEVVYNGVEQTLKDYSARSQPLHSMDNLALCIIGRIHAAKGQEEAIRALPYLRSLEPVLHIAGTGQDDYIEHLKDVAKSLSVDEQVIWHGFADVEEIFRQSDINLVCSRSEAFGRVVIEAMATGCPTIGTDSGGIPELIEHGKTGLLYEKGNLKKLAENILKLSDDPSLYAAISSQALAFSRQHFKPQHYVNQIQQLITDVAEA